VRDRWVAAFGLGLLHGFGFSAALVDLGVPRGTLASSLFGFNLAGAGGNGLTLRIEAPDA
jgi:hypothetical protein